MENGGKMRCRSMKSARKTSASSRVIIMFRLHSWRAITTRCQDLRHIQLARLRLWCMRNEKFNFFIFTERKKTRIIIQFVSRSSSSYLFRSSCFSLWCCWMIKMCKDSLSAREWKSSCRSDSSSEAENMQINSTILEQDELHVEVSILCSFFCAKMH